MSDTPHTNRGVMALLFALLALIVAAVSFIMAGSKDEG